jgi:hypothetical protein
VAFVLKALVVFLAILEALLAFGVATLVTSIKWISTILM